MSRVGLIERFRDRLPFAPEDPVVSLLEGSTPLVLAERVSERVGAEVWLKLEGANPTGSFKDRGMTCAVSAAVRDGAEAVICASTGNTAASAAAYAARAGLTGAVIVPDGKIATGKLAQALMHGARVIALRGNFDEALALVRELTARHPIALVNSVNPFRLEGQKTAAFEIVEELGDGLDALCIPVGNAGNITAYWTGFTEAGARPRMLGWQAEGAAPLVHGAPVAQPETVASAIRIGNPARWEEAMGAMAASHGAIRAVSDDEILDAYRFLAAHEGVFCEPASAAGVAGLLKHGAEERGAGRVRAHRPRPQGPADRAVARRLGRALRAGDRRRRARRARMTARRVRVPASSANLGPGFDVLACALGLHVELEVEETGSFAVVSDLPIALDRRNLAVRGFAALHPVDAVEFRIRSDVPLSGGLGTSAAAIVAGLVAAASLYGLRGRPARRRDAARRPSRQRGRRAARRLRAVRRRRRGALRGARRARGGAGRPARARPHGGRARDAARGGADGRRGLQRRATRACSCSASCAATGTSSPAGCTTGSTSRTARTCTRARSRSPTARPSSARSAPRSRARGRPSWCGASAGRPRGCRPAWRRSARAGRTCAPSPSSRTAPRWCRRGYAARPSPATSIRQPAR